MRKPSALFLLAFLLLAVGCHPGNTRVPGFSYPESTYPTKPGSRWVMRQEHYQDGKLMASWEEETTLLRVEGDLLTYGVRSKMGSQTTESRFFLVKRRDALYFRSETQPIQEGSTHSLEDAVLLLKFPLMPDQHWTYQHPTEGEASRTVMDQETITVPAGTYRAVRIEEKRDSGSGFSWFAPDVGIVRSDLSGTSSRYQKELIKFEAAR